MILRVRSFQILAMAKIYFKGPINNLPLVTWSIFLSIVAQRTCYTLRKEGRKEGRKARTGRRERERDGRKEKERERRKSEGERGRERSNQNALKLTCEIHRSLPTHRIGIRSLSLVWGVHWGVCERNSKNQFHVVLYVRSWQQV